VRDQRPIQTARRKARQRERECRGIAVPPCHLCIEAHHTAGRNHDAELTAQICEMHHCAIHEQIRKVGISLEHELDEVKRVALALRAAAIYDHERADAMERWASLLEHNLEAKS
jgi:hypothetical protein